MSQKIRKERITKVEFHKRGGFGNPELFRQQSRGGAWRYYVSLDGPDIYRALAAEIFSGEAQGRSVARSSALGASYGKQK